MYLDIKKNYPFYIALYLTVALILHNYNEKDIMPKKYAFKNVSWYSLFFGFGSFLAVMYLSSCNLPYISIMLLSLLVLIARWIVCLSCRESYSIATQYAITIPILTIIFSCDQLSVIITAIAIASAFGRIGCICAGCCTGKKTNKEDFHYTYNGKKQIINVKLKQPETTTKPTVIYEAIIQLCIAGLCLHFPHFAPLIYGLGTSILLIATKFWRMEERENILIGILAMMILIYKCHTKIEGICINNREPDVLIALLISVIQIYFISSDMFSKKKELFSQSNKGVSIDSGFSSNLGVSLV